VPLSRNNPGDITGIDPDFPRKIPEAERSVVALRRCLEIFQEFPVIEVVE
jgi:hypothetical protein